MSAAGGGDIDTERAVRALLGRHAVGFAINFAGTVVLARLLGPALWGVYSIAYVLQIIVQGLLERGTVGYLVQRRAAPGPVETGTTLVAQTLAGAAAMALLLAGAGPLADFYSDRSLVPLVVAVAFSGLAYSARAVPLGLLERSLSYRRVAAVEIADLATFNLVGIAGVVAGLGFGALAVATVARALTSLLVAWRLGGTRFAPRWSAPVLRELAAFALPFTGSNALGWVNVAAAPVLVGRFAGTRELGILQLAYTMVLYPQLLTSIIGRVALPVYSRLRDDDRLRRAVDDGTSAALRYMGGATLALAAAGPLWVPIVFGREWIDMVPIMITVAPALGFSMSLVMVVAALNARGFVNATLGITLVFAIVYWSLGLVTVPPFGALGLSLAQAVATLAYAGFLALYRRQVGGLLVRASLAEYTIVCLLALAIGAWSATGGSAVGELVGAAAILLLVLRNADPRRFLAWLGVRTGRS